MIITEAHLGNQGPEEAKARLNTLAEIGFDDAIVTVSDFSEEHMARVRALHT